MVDSDTDNSDAEYRGPSLRANASASGGRGGGFPFSRSTIGRYANGHGRADHQSLQLYDAVNYPNERELSFQTWWSYYHREGQVAGVLDQIIDDTWQGGAPSVTDDKPTDGDDADEDTAFESDIEELFAPGTDSDLDLRAPLLGRLIAADLLATLGKYAVILFGFADDNSVDEPLEKGACDGLDDLAYVEVFAEPDVDFELEDDLDADRYGRPETYELGDDGTEVHHSRVVHVAENTLTDPYEGIPWFKPVVNVVANIQKILAGSGEGYFRAGHPGYAISPPPTFKEFGDMGNTTVKKVPGSFGDKKDVLETSIQDAIRNYQRAFATNGEIETLAPNISDPSPHMAIQWEAFAAAKNLPQSIIKGNETGERATTEDSAALRRHISGRRNRHAETALFRPALDVPAYAGVIASPDDGDYTVEWSPLSEPTDEELAARRQTEAETIATWGQMAGTPPVTLAEFRKAQLDMDPERGSEAPGSEGQQDGDAPDARTIMDRMGIDVEDGQQPTADTPGDGGVPDATSPAATDGGVTAGQSRITANAEDTGDGSEDEVDDGE